MALVSSLSQLPGALGSLNYPEIIKELVANMGFKDGKRFITEGDPRMQEMEQMIQQLQQELEGKQVDMQARMQIQEMKNQGNANVAMIRAEAELKAQQMRLQLGDLEIQIKLQNEDTKRGELMLQRDALIQKIMESERQSSSNNVMQGKSGVISNDDYGNVPYAQG